VPNNPGARQALVQSSAEVFTNQPGASTFGSGQGATSVGGGIGRPQPIMSGVKTSQPHASGGINFSSSQPEYRRW
jgi:hypothetical protein